MTEYLITAESFGDTIPENWEEIAAYLNARIDEMDLDSLPERERHDAVNDLWDEFWSHGGDLPATRTVYLSVSSRVPGDSFTLCCTYDPDEARKALSDDWAHMTKGERSCSRLHIDGYSVEAFPDESAEEAFRRFEEGKAWLPDPDYYEEFKAEEWDGCREI